MSLKINKTGKHPPGEGVEYLNPTLISFIASEQYYHRLVASILRSVTISMKPDTRTRYSFYAWPGYIFATMLLAMAVFAWGTSYKLSLYKTAYSGKSMPEAKLCTRASDIAQSEIAAAVSGALPHPPRSSFLILAFLACLAMAASGPVLDRIRQKSPPPRFTTAFTPSLFFRPPPSLAIAFS